jgi:hypothetical protein
MARPKGALASLLLQGGHRDVERRFQVFDVFLRVLHCNEIPIAALLVDPEDDRQSPAYFRPA